MPGAAYIVSIMESTRLATAPSMSSTSRVRSFSTGSPYWRMVSSAMAPILPAAPGPTRLRDPLHGAAGPPRPADPGRRGRGTRARRSQSGACAAARTRNRPSLERRHRHGVPVAEVRVAGRRLGRPAQRLGIAGGEDAGHEQPSAANGGSPDRRRIAVSSASTGRGLAPETAVRTA